MQNRSLPKFIITTSITLCLFCFVGSLSQLSAQNEPLEQAAQENPNSLQEQARQYRQAGLENQRMGNLPAAMSLYQKAIAIDPGYAVAYNDLGVVYEAANFPERAEESYLKSIKIDPDYLSAYTNLALFYENQRDLEKAAYYWAKRAGSGAPDDLWTQRAASRLKDIRLVLSNRPIADQREEDVLGLMKDTAVYKSVLNKDDKALAQTHFLKAKQNYNKGDLATAVKEALDAQYLDQDNREIEVFTEKAVLRALSH
ncbi:MAG: tetratricopeptide repeat protein [Candidatus Omnitrophota bacterium]|nr:tetratricopeptide repeat protein [Candidatus Omnitrophota bacterium]